MDESADKKKAILRDIWCDVLGVDDVQLDDDFFTLGGESISAVTVVSRISNRLGVDVSLEELYEHNTFAELAARIVNTSADTVRARPSM